MTQASYNEGLALGTKYAEADRSNGAPFAFQESELRADAREAREDLPPWRAFKLGIVRGYRASTRSLLDGRWGT